MNAFLPILGLIGRFAVGAAFVVSGFSKAVGSPADFAAVIDAYAIVPASLTLPMAKAMPWLELVLGTYLLAGLERRRVAAALGVFLLMFEWALGSAKFRGIDLGTCGCFGRVGPQLQPWQAMVLDAVLLALAVAVWMDRTGLYSLDRYFERDAQAPPPPPRAERRRTAA
jgi:uncharacterized membrane protein YphA (DoxX/SURF4 family)